MIAANRLQRCTGPVLRVPVPFVGPSRIWCPRLRWAEIIDSSRKPVTAVAVASSFVLVASFVVLYLVLSSDALTSNLMDGRYPSGTEGLQARGGALASAVLALGGYAGLIWARAKLKTPLVRVLCGLFGVALVAYLPATLFVCVTAFG